MSDSDRKLPLSIDWRDLSDNEMDAALKEIVRRRLQRLRQISPAPWAAHSLKVVDACGVEICHCGGAPAGYGGATPVSDRAMANAAHCAVGPDGVELAKLVIENVGLRIDLIAAAKALLAKAGIA